MLIREEAPMPKEMVVRNNLYPFHQLFKVGMSFAIIPGETEKFEDVDANTLFRRVQSASTEFTKRHEGFKFKVFREEIDGKLAISCFRVEEEDKNTN